MLIERFVSDLLQSNMYIVSEDGHAIVIDPYRNTEVASKYKVDYILLTHEHYDHISGVNQYKLKYNVPLICSEVCGKNITKTTKNGVRHYNYFCKMQKWIKVDQYTEAEKGYTCTADITYKEEYNFQWQGHCVDFFPLPGHSEGSTGILIDQKYLFSGDAIIPGTEPEAGMTNTSKRQWREISIPRLKQLPNNIIVYPGHFDMMQFNYIIGEIYENA